MQMLPALRNGSSLATRDQTRAANRAQAQTELMVFEHGLDLAARAHMDRLDSQALSDVVRVALDEELDLLDYGMSKVGNSVAKMELVARKVDLLANTNERRIRRRFGS